MDTRQRQGWRTGDNTMNDTGYCCYCGKETHILCRDCYTPLCPSHGVTICGLCERVQQIIVQGRLVSRLRPSTQPLQSGDKVVLSDPNATQEFTVVEK